MQSIAIFDDILCLYLSYALRDYFREKYRITHIRNKTVSRSVLWLMNFAIVFVNIYSITSMPIGFLLTYFHFMSLYISRHRF